MAAAIALSLPALMAMAAQVRTVVQKGRAFSVKQMSVAVGDTIRFQNADEFLHHVYIDSPGLKFTSDEQEPGQTVDVRFPVAGRFDVRCEIHPKMLLTVAVE